MSKFIFSFVGAALFVTLQAGVVHADGQYPLFPQEAPTCKALPGLPPSLSFYKGGQFDLELAKQWLPKSYISNLATYGGPNGMRDLEITNVCEVTGVQMPTHVKLIMLSVKYNFEGKVTVGTLHVRFDVAGDENNGKMTVGIADLKSMQDDTPAERDGRRKLKETQSYAQDWQMFFNQLTQSVGGGVLETYFSANAESLR